MVGSQRYNFFGIMVLVKSDLMKHARNLVTSLMLFVQGAGWVQERVDDASDGDKEDEKDKKFW